MEAGDRWFESSRCYQKESSQRGVEVERACVGSRRPLVRIQPLRPNGGDRSGKSSGAEGGHLDWPPKPVLSGFDSCRHCQWILGFLIFDFRFWIERRDGGERSFELRFAIVERKDAYSRVSAQSQIKNQKSKIAAWCRGCAGRIARLWALRGGFDSRTTPHNRDCRVAEQTEALACKAGSRGCKSRRGIQTAGIRE